VTLDGVPVGGPFNPSLAQIPVEDIDRIEIVKGPQGTLYGVSAFAGMISIFTRGGSGEHGRLTLGGGTFGVGQGSGSLEHPLGPESRVRLSGSAQRSDGCRIGPARRSIAARSGSRLVWARGISTSISRRSATPRSGARRSPMRDRSCRASCSITTRPRAARGSITTCWR